MIQQRIPAARASLPLTAAWPTIKQDSQFVAASLFYQRAENVLTSKPVLGAFAVLVLLWLACVAAFAADENLPPNSPIAASSGNVANATATATLAEKAGFLNRICGFQITSGGATAPSLVSATVTGVQGGRKLALKLGQASASVQCTMGKAKILGLIIDRREVGEVGAFDHMTDDELVEEAKKRAAALGLSPDPKLVN